MYKRILKYLLPYKRHFIIGSIFAFAFSIANGITLYTVVPIFDTLSPGNEKYSLDLSAEELNLLNKELNNTDIGEKIEYYKVQFKYRVNDLIKGISKLNFLIYICIGLFFIIFIRMIFKLLSVYYIGYAGYGAIRDIREVLYRSTLDLPLTFFHKHKTGDLISKIIYNTDLISGSLSNQLRKAVMNLFIVITHIALLLYINYELTLLTFVALLFITIPIIFIGRAFREYSKIEQEKMSEISSNVLETLEGIRIIKSFQMENLQISRFFGFVKTLFAKKMRKSMIDIGRPHIVEIISSVFLAFLFIYGGGIVLAGEFSKGEFIFFLFTFLFIMNPIKQLANMNNQIKQAEAAGEGIFTIIDHEKEYEVNKDKIESEESIAPEKEIQFKNLSFKYPESSAYALRNINFKIPAGKTTAIVGPSGAGKTTLLDMLPRFFEPTEGTILIDNTDIQTLPLHAIRKSIGIVTQEIFLFNGTIAENIAYSRRNIPFDRIIEAAKTANAHDFILQMPEKYDTRVGERGIMLSGGERQRIAIARSILRNPPILILDEATSSLDTESEKLVQGALNKLMRDRTSFVIAHRLSTIINADLIIVLDNSKIAETGTHEELLKKGGIYKKLYDMQFSKEV